MSTTAAAAAPRDTGVELRPDPTRVVTRFFVPGREDVGPGDSRAAPVIERLLELDERDVELALADVDVRFSGRHRDLPTVFREHAELVTSRLDPTRAVSPARRQLLGAAFTHEYAIEGAALCNPSAVMFPMPTADGDVRFVMSVRGIGEGHKSTIGFRTGTLTAAGDVTIDAPGPFPTTTAAAPALHHRAVVHAKLAEMDDDHENAAYVLDALPARFDDEELAARISALTDDLATRRNTPATIANLREVAGSSYSVVFPNEVTLSERVLWPASPAEHQGMEDARFVRFTDTGGRVCYYATYTAFDGQNIAQHLIETEDFSRFAVSPMAGGAAVGKGLALFPRRVGGRFAALTRADRETNGVAFSYDVRCWDEATTIQLPTRPWEILQLGNCGSPIETADGWLVITHGVGPMRTYSLGAVLLDLDEPQRVLAASVDPILTPSAARRDGYVPNVVYSCGGFAHGDRLVLPYGVGDQTIAVAIMSITDLLASLQPV